MTASFGDVFDAVAQAVRPEDPAILCDEEILSWGEFSRRTNSFARALREAGLAPGAKLAQYMRNSPDYLIAFIGAFKARVAPVNVNYRYGAAELEYLMTNSDAEAVVFDIEFADVVRTLRPRLGVVKTWIVSGGKLDDFASMEDLVSGDGDALDVDRSPSDMFLLYTGGTTGLPKGVMWPSEVWWEVLAAGRAVRLGLEPPASLSALQDQIRTGEGRLPVFIAPPLMHGTGLFTSVSAMSKAAPVVLTRAPRFEPSRVLEAMTRWRCGGLAIVGDAFGKPLLEELRSGNGRYDVSSCLVVTSSGMMWSPEVKEGLLEFMPDAQLFDSFGSSEGTGLGASVTVRGARAEEARFDAPNTLVVRETDFMPVAPGSGEIGLIAKWGNLPLGYYKDPEKTARTYVTINGVRHLLSGDHATVEADGRIRLLGRGSHCINSGGEKIYPEEVEEALKSHPGVVDALVFGRPDPRFGQSISAVVETVKGLALSETDLVEHVRSRLAHYKAPRTIVFSERVPRAPNGKPDYASARAMFDAAVTGG
ncbi:MAG: AMP-binding protein [Alphaproteobacteria bacterium]|nr:AMP-binding protein [Alphaproteobacteria bacterium]